MDETINQMIAEISAMPLWDADIRAQGYEPVILCNHPIMASLRRDSHYSTSEDFLGAGTFCGLKIIIMDKVNCPVISFIKIYHS